jgi:hypothetical protein
MGSSRRRAWWLQLHAFLNSLGFVANKCDVCFYVLKLAGGAYVLLLLYVDDIIMAAMTPALVKHYVGLISKRFKLSCEGPLDRYLGFKAASICRGGESAYVWRSTWIGPISGSVWLSSSQWSPH